jgi:hypothetical protein
MQMLAREVLKGGIRVGVKRGLSLKTGMGGFRSPWGPLMIAKFWPKFSESW